MAKMLREMFPTQLPHPYEKQLRKMEELEKVSAQATEKDLTGFIVKQQIADGYAEYVVVKDTGKTIELKHINLFDAYSAHPAFLRGLTRADVLRLFAFAKAFAPLMG